MNKEVEDYLRVQRKLVVLEYAKVFGSNLEAYKACGIPRSTFYDWKKAYNNEGDLNEKLKLWEHFYNFNRQHGAFDGKTPYEALKCALENTDLVR